MKQLLLSLSFLLYFIGSASGQLLNDSVVDYDGNVYHTVKIGTQIWMVENLKVTHYRNGVELPKVQDSVEWGKLTTGAYCSYPLYQFALSKENRKLLEQTMGKLYNGYTVLDTNGITPSGWHVPTRAEWQVLIEYLGGNAVAGGKLKDTLNWRQPSRYFNTYRLLTTNESGFTALPDGIRTSIGAFISLAETGQWWTSSLVNEDMLRTWMILYTRNNVYPYPQNLNCGFSIRCIKDS